MRTLNQAQVQPWFREPMVWMVILVPLTAVIVGMTMLTVSIQNYDGLVVDDYYKHGKEINRVLDRSVTASENQLNAVIDIDPAQNIELVLTHQNSFQKPDQVTLKLLHRTRSGLDQVVKLTRYADSVYRGRFDASIDGIWSAQLETDDWRIVGSIRLPQDRFILTAR